MSCRRLYFRYLSTQRPANVSISDSGDCFSLTVSGNQITIFNIPKNGKAERTKYKSGKKDMEYVVRGENDWFSIGRKYGVMGSIQSGFQTIFIGLDAANLVRKTISKARKDIDPDDYNAELALVNA